MLHYAVIWEALQQALNLSVIGAVVTGLFLIKKTKSDLRLGLEQLDQKTVQEARNAGQTELKDLNAGITADRNYWQGRAKEAEALLLFRDKTLAEMGTNYSEALAMLQVDGAMASLRAGLAAHLQKPVGGEHPADRDER